MGWIYGSTVVTGNNNLASANSAVSHQYDKIFSNRYLMDNTDTEDGVFLGRKVLVDYNQSLLDTLLRVVEVNGAYYYWKELKLKPISLTQIEFEENKSQYEYFYKSDDEYIPIETWLTNFNTATEFYVKDTYSVLDLVSKGSIPKNTYVYVSNVDVPTKLSDISLLQCTSDLVQSKTNEAAVLSTSSVLNDYLINNSQLSFYEFNKYVDKNHYSLQGVDYLFDSTVWQKVYINNIEKYVMIAKLNADNPNIDLDIIQPCSNGLPNLPALNINGEDQYKLYMSIQPGLRISNKPNYPVYIYKPNSYYYRDENLEWALDDSLTKQNRDYYILGSDQTTYTLVHISFDSFPENRNIYKMYNGAYEEIKPGDEWDINNTYVVLSDTKVKYSYYTNNTPTQIETVDDQDGAIFFNKDGFNKTKRTYFDTTVKPDQITSQFNGKSGYNYENHIVYYPIEFKDSIDESSNTISAEDHYLEYSKNDLYYLVDDENGYVKVGESDGFDSTLQYFVRTVSSNSNIDTHQLEIILPTIGNMICEGWDKIYGCGDKWGNRNLNRYVYTYESNNLDGDPTTVNKDEDSLIGLYNFYAEEVRRLRGYDESFSSTTSDNVRSSIPLATSINVIEDTEFTATIQLTQNDIIQNQININNLGLQKVIEKIGLDYSNAIGYERITNVTQDSYMPNLYYYPTYVIDNSEFQTEGRDYYLLTTTDEGEQIYTFTEINNTYTPGTYYYPESFTLDSSNNFIANRNYYVCRINTVDFDGNKISGTIQAQINANYDQREANKLDLSYRRADIHKLAELIGLAKAQDGTEQSAATLAIKSKIAADTDLTDQKVYDNSIQGQIYRNDEDIEAIIDLLGFTRGGYDQLSDDNVEKRITNGTTGNTIASPLQTQITYNDNDIQKLTNRIRRIEEFLLDGHFVFTNGRSPAMMEYYYDNLQPLPGEGSVDTYILASVYEEGVNYYIKTMNNGQITYDINNSVTRDNFVSNVYYKLWNYTNSEEPKSYIPF